MKINKIVWLEDQMNTMRYYEDQLIKSLKSKSIELIKVERTEGVVRFCEGYIGFREPDYLLLLDLLIIGEEQIVVPADYYKPVLPAANWCKTYGEGHDAGLLIYEKLFIDSYIDKENMHYTPTLTPPPVAFLSVSDLDFARHRERFQKIQDMTQNKLRIKDVTIYQKWISKFGFGVEKILSMLEELC